MTAPTDAFDEVESAESSNEEDVLTPEVKREVKAARRCFVTLEKMTSMMMSYPPGHPIVEESAQRANDTLADFFELTDRLSVLVDAHSMKYLGTKEVVWRTEDPKDYCWMLSRDGVYLIHILAGIQNHELRRFIEILNELVDERDMTQDAVSTLFEANFKYISYDALDESLAALAGIETDIRNRDTKEEQELIEELFDEVFDKEKQKELDKENPDKRAQDFRVRMQKRAERQRRLEVGSRQFLNLTDEQQRHLIELKKGFTEHAQLEHREGEILAAILGARPKERLREQAVDQIGEVMGSLLETMQPWEALAFLKIIHVWREKFDQETTMALKDAVASSFDKRRIATLIKMIAIAEPDVRRAILTMFNALHLDNASEELVRLLGWDVNAEVRDDVVRFLRERSRYGLGFLKDTIFEIPPEHAQPLLDIIIRWMPKSRKILVQMVQRDVEPEIKQKAIRALSGTWTPDEAKFILSPLLKASNDQIRIAALRGFADAAPDQVAATLAPLFTPELAQRPAEETREIASLFLRYGGERAVDKLRELIHVRCPLVSEDQRELAATMAKMAARAPSPEIIELLRSVAKDFLVPGKVRNTCKELVSLLER
jgi:hypothetical protein